MVSAPKKREKKKSFHFSFLEFISAGLTFSSNTDKEPNAFETGKNLEDAFVDENHKDYRDSKWLYDTPGIVQNDQIINLLTTEELLDVVPKKVLWPRVFYMQPGQSLFLAGLGRVDYIGGATRLRLSVYASDRLPILIVDSMHADQVYEECLGSELMCVPRGDAERMAKWLPLQRSEDKITVSGYESERKSVCGE